MRKLNPVLGIVSAGFLASASFLVHAQDITVTLDAFDEPQDELTVTSGASDSNQVTLSNGATRTMTVTNTAGSLSTSSIIIGGEYALSNDAGGTRGEGTVTWSALGGVDLSFADELQILVTGGDATASLGTPVSLTVTSGGNSQTLTDTASAVNDLPSYPFTIDLSNVTQLEMVVDGTGRDGVDVEVDLLQAVGDFIPPSCTSKSFSGVPGDNPLLAGATWDTSITVSTNGATSISFSDSMSSGLAVDAMGALPSGCTSTASSGDTSFSVSCDGVSANSSLTFNYTTTTTADFSDGTLTNTVSNVCGTFAGSDERCGSGCSDSISRTPPAVPVPGITTWGLISALIGLPLIAGILATRRRRQK